jgi:hypothetical protein
MRAAAAEATADIDGACMCDAFEKQKEEILKGRLQT